MPPLSAALSKTKLCIDFATLRYACPKGIYVAPVPQMPLLWNGVVFVQKGPYASAILRFKIDFAHDYPARPPIVSFLSDVFHPLVTPLTTYTYTTRDSGADTVSAADRDRLPPGGLNLRHGFPEWFETARDGVSNKEMNTSQVEPKSHHPNSPAYSSTFLTIQVLQYIRVVFDTAATLDSVPLDAAANKGAWHAWRSYQSKSIGGRASPIPNVAQDSTEQAATSPQQQPGGARRPGEWNWQGVWEDRVRRSIQASLSEQILFGDHSGVICFSKVEPDAIAEIMPAQWRTQGHGVVEHAASSEQH